MCKFKHVFPYKITLYFLLSSIAIHNDALAEDFHRLSESIGDFSPDFKQCIRRAEGFHLVLLSCAWQEGDFQQKRIAFYQKKIANKLKGIARRKFSNDQTRLDNKISDYCDQHPNYDLFRSDREGGGLETDACIMNEYAKAASALRRYYNRLHIPSR